MMMMMMMVDVLWPLLSKSYAKWAVSVSGVELVTFRGRVESICLGFITNL